MKKRKKLFLTGACGFIGKNLIEKFYQEYEITAIDQKVDYQFINRFNIIVYELDLTNFNKLSSIIKDVQPNIIINLASIVTAERDYSLFSDMINSNISILMNLYQASKDLDSLNFFIQLGSGEEYGNIKPPFKETDKEKPNSPYAIAKLTVSNTAMMLYRNNGFPICVVRPGNLFGKYQGKDKFIPYIIDCLNNNKKIKMSPGEQKRDFIFIDYFIEKIKIILNLQKHIGEIFNISSGHSISLKKVVEYLKILLSSTSIVEYASIPYRENEIMDFRLDNTKFNLINGCFDVKIKTQLENYLKDVQ